MALFAGSLARSAAPEAPAHLSINWNEPSKIDTFSLFADGDLRVLQKPDLATTTRGLLRKQQTSDLNVQLFLQWMESVRLRRPKIPVLTLPVAERLFFLYGLDLKISMPNDQRESFAWRLLTERLNRTFRSDKVRFVRKIAPNRLPFWPSDLGADKRMFMILELANHSSITPWTRMRRSREGRFLVRLNLGVSTWRSALAVPRRTVRLPIRSGRQPFGC